MKDYLASIEKLRKDAAEAALIRDLTNDNAKRQMYQRLHDHLLRMANEVEQAIRAPKPAPSAPDGEATDRS
jgi:hypothetical protein